MLVQLVQGPLWRWEIPDHPAEERSIWDLKMNHHAAKSSVGPTLKSAIMRVERECMRGHRRKGLFLIGGMKECCLEEAV